MVVDYKVEGASFVPGKPRLWSDKHLFYTGTTNLYLAPDGKRFAVLAPVENAGPEKGSVHVVFLQTSYLRRRAGLVVYQTNRAPNCTARGELDWVVIVPNTVLVAVRLGDPKVTRLVVLNVSNRNCK